jgi:hypothetical protein
VEIEVEPESPVQFAVNLRIPGWLGHPAGIDVNGKPARVKAEPGSWASVTRRWRRGDRIGLTLPFSFRVMPVDDRHRDTVAVLYGPVMLVAVDPPERLAASAAALTGMQAVPGKPLEFECRTSAGNVRMRPFYQVQREPYTTYFQRTADV